MIKPHGSALSNEARPFSSNSRIIGFACERRDGDGKQLAGGGLQMMSLLVATLRWQSFSPHFEPSKER
jgi:hypothetical protein